MFSGNIPPCGFASDTTGIVSWRFQKKQSENRHLCRQAASIPYEMLA
jgi:hypothetical protein